MTEIQNSKLYDLEERTLQFAKRVYKFCKKLPHNVCDFEILKQLIRAAGSTGANYIEANESLSKKDFIMRIKISRKEAKECIYWLKIIEVSNSEIQEEQNYLLKESAELMKIFGSILQKSK